MAEGFFVGLDASSGVGFCRAFQSFLEVYTCFKLYGLGFRA